MALLPSVYSLKQMSLNFKLHKIRLESVCHVNLKMTFNVPSQVYLLNSYNPTKNPLEVPYIVHALQIDHFAWSRDAAECVQRKTVG